MIRTRKWAWAAVAAGAVLGLATVRVRAHEIKVMLDRMSAQKGDQDVVFLSWGHLLPTEGPTHGEDVERYQLLSPSGSVRALTTDKESDQRNAVHLEEEGLYTAEVVRKPSILTIFTFGDRHLHLVGPKTEVQAGAKVEDSFRSFQSSKAMVTAGGGGSEAPKPIGHALEIVPAIAPAEWAVGRDLPFQVLFEGKPLSGELFQAKPLDFKPDDVWTWTRPTDQSGTAVLRPDRAGTWLLKATFERPAPLAERERFDADHWTATLLLHVGEKK